MCCGAKRAASKQYVAPPIYKEDTMTNKHPTYKPVGAYYGNPVPVKKSKQLKKDAETHNDKHDASDKEALDLLPKTHAKK